MRQWMQRMIVAALALTLLLGPVPQTSAQTTQRCFTETNQCIAGRIREFWERNGGLPVFGLPIAPQREEIIEGKPFQVQWFERNRLELHPENPRPYDVLLGRLGGDRLAQQGRDWFSFPKSEPRQDCRFFAETGHNVCGAILSSWRSQGLQLDGRRSVSESESLALFGLPLSDEQTETINGVSYSVQWFERARFEIHPENQPPYNVLLGLLGVEIHGFEIPASTPRPGPAADYSGTWQGTTSQNKAITFTISGSKIMAVEVDFDFDFGSCRATGPASITYHIGGIDFTGTTFSVPVGTRSTVNGTFNSPTSASGELKYRINEGGCQGEASATWTAVKQ